MVTTQSRRWMYVGIHLILLTFLRFKMSHNEGRRAPQAMTAPRSDLGVGPQRGASTAHLSDAHSVPGPLRGRDQDRGRPAGARERVAGPCWRREAPRLRTHPGGPTLGWQEAACAVTLGFPTLFPESKLSPTLP